MSKGLIKGRFSKTEMKFIKENYEKLTDREMATSLNRDIRAVTNVRKRLGLKPPKRKTRTTQSHRVAFVGNLNDKEKRDFFEKEVKNSAQYKALLFSLDSNELSYYVEKWVNFMTDSTIETMTSSEKDSLHTMILAEIKINQLLRIEKDYKDNMKDEFGVPISKVKEIKDMQDVILRCQTNLNVERRQRLKNQNDQTITFTNIIKDLKNPRIREIAGKEAAMLKYMGEASYNNLVLKNKIKSGRPELFDLSGNFKSDELEFLPSYEELSDKK